MQPVTFDKFTNSSGWHVVHDQDDMTYKIVSATGRRLDGKWTNRRMAEKKLYDYLTKNEQFKSPGRGGKKAQKAKAEQKAS